jgi:O-antigen ligase
VVITLQLAGPQVTDRFVSAFADEKERDTSAQSRLEMWMICLRVIEDRPIFGLGPLHFAHHAHEFGLTKGKEAHSLWLQLGAELGVPGVGFLVLFYLLCVVRLWPVRKESSPVPDPWFRDTARMVIASIGGFMFTAQFVSLPGLEAPYYVTLLGAGALKLLSAPNAQAAVAPFPTAAGGSTAPPGSEK